MITMTLLVVIYFTGNQIHELLGIAFILEFTLHKLLNIKSIVAMLRQLWKRVSQGKAKTLIVTDIILTVMILLSCISGIFISKYIFAINTAYIAFWYILHSITSYLSVVVVLFHTFLHRNQIISGINNMFKITASKIQAHLFNLFLIACLAASVSLFFENDTVKKMKTIYTLSKPKVETTTTLPTVVPTITEPTKTTTTTTEETTPVVTKKKTVVKKVTPTAAEITKFLGGMRCNGCEKRCLLTRPQCIIGEQRAEQETVTYIQNYTASK